MRLKSILSSDGQIRYFLGENEISLVDWNKINRFVGGSSTDKSKEEKEKYLNEIKKVDEIIYQYFINSQIALDQLRKYSKELKKIDEKYYKIFSNITFVQLDDLLIFIDKYYEYAEEIKKILYQIKFKNKDDKDDRDKEKTIEELYKKLLSLWKNYTNQNLLKELLLFSKFKVEDTTITALMNDNKSNKIDEVENKLKENMEEIRKIKATVIPELFKLNLIEFLKGNKMTNPNPNPKGKQNELETYFQFIMIKYLKFLLEYNTVEKKGNRYLIYTKNEFKNHVDKMNENELTEIMNEEKLKEIIKPLKILIERVKDKNFKDKILKKIEYKTTVGKFWKKIVSKIKHDKLIEQAENLSLEKSKSQRKEIIKYLINFTYHNIYRLIEEEYINKELPKDIKKFINRDQRQKIHIFYLNRILQDPLYNLRDYFEDENTFMINTGFNSIIKNMKREYLFTTDEYTSQLEIKRKKFNKENEKTKRILEKRESKKIHPMITS